MLLPVRILNGEYGLTRAILSSDFTIDTLLYKFQGVDWRQKYVPFIFCELFKTIRTQSYIPLRSNWNCNQNYLTGRNGLYEGTSVDPFEVSFIC